MTLTHGVTSSSDENRCPGVPVEECTESEVLVDNNVAPVIGHLHYFLCYTNSDNDLPKY